MTEFKKNIKYLRDRNIPYDGLTELEVSELVKSNRLKLRKEGSIRRTQSLISKGLISEKKYAVCKTCNTEYKINSYQYSKLGYCKSGCAPREERNIIYIKGYLETRGYDTSGDWEEVLKTFHTVRSEDIKPTQYKRVDTIKKTYATGFKEIGIKGKQNHRVSFLKEHGIVEDVESLTEDEINSYYIKNFNKLSKRGDIIKEGILQKHGTKENVKKAYQEIFQKVARNSLQKKGLVDEQTSPEEIKKIWRENMSKERKGNKDRTMKWKIAHLVNKGVDVKNKTNVEISVLYSEYMSERQYTVPESIHNGYTNTEKGYYDFKNIELSLFYRSSWEKKVFECLDSVSEFHKFEVKIPNKIKYFYENMNKHYHPDVSIVTSSGVEYVLEIKPKSKVNEPKNMAKFNSAIEKLGDNFKVITEDLIFSDTFKDYIEQLVK